VSLLLRFQNMCCVKLIPHSGCIASIFRLRALYTSTKTKDPTWDKTGTVYWSAIELNVGVMCASMPTLRCLFSRFFPNVLGNREDVQQISNIVDTGMAKFADLENSGETEKELGTNIELGKGGHGARLYSCYENLPSLQQSSGSS
jgi:hypothetical protein